ncbi:MULTISPECIES: type III pantothenate kinase [unclassified Zunongwangia]|uniref:type III pantothenate kinase n=1 Tax=unclassified Zunongwangia TaxID=2632541 RepID=UPI0022DD7B60|nr:MULTISPECIES: type III pantothenate kinase [unclassified Zunongwangia]WBL21967.1 type III pantothenate kinase [Zunongwangia sp. HRR-M8]WBL26080.1 type III pantothenate kinase [Zunongwangia sp. HGR-M22]
MNLVIDLGNTFAKIAVFQNDKSVELFRVLKSEKNKKIEEIFEAYPQIEFSILSSVLYDDSSLVKFLQKRSKSILLDQQTKIPFHNKYGSPETLGKDRIALAAAAVCAYPNQNCLIIDAGTCVTYDYVNDQSQYLGGGISPGLQMRFNAVHKFTEKLPLIHADSNHLKLVGNSTEESIKSGICFGFAAEIDGMISSYKSKFKDLTVILTGGDSLFLSKRLKNSIFANSNFLLEGLNYILEFNKNQ